MCPWVRRLRRLLRLRRVVVDWREGSGGVEMEGNVCGWLEMEMEGRGMF